MRILLFERTWTLASYEERFRFVSSWVLGQETRVILSCLTSVTAAAPGSCVLRRRWRRFSEEGSKGLISTRCHQSVSVPVIASALAACGCQGFDIIQSLKSSWHHELDV